MTGAVAWRARLEDGACLAGLHAASFRDAWPEAAFQDLLAREGIVVLLVSRTGQAQRDGFVMMRVIDKEAEILTFAVMPAARRSGLGTLLLESAIELAAGEGVRQIFLEVNEDNLVARALYDRFGFVHAGRRRAYYAQGSSAADALVLKKSLP